jgi:hypothetical protein
MNSSGEIVVVDNTEVPTGPNTGSGVDDPLFQSESFRTPTHTAGIFNPSSAPSSVRDLYGTLGMSSNQPMASQMPETFVTYTVPLDHFTGTTSNVTTVSDQLLVGSHSILPLQMAHSTMVPQATTVSTGNVVITQAPIGTPLPLRPNPSLPPGYNALNTSIAIPTQNPSRGSRLFVPPGYNVASQFVPTPTQVLSGGPYVPPPPLFGGSNHPGPSGSNPVGGTSHSVTSGFQIPVGGQPQVGGKPQFGGQPQIGGQPQLGGKPQVGGHNPVYGQNIPVLQSQPWNLPFQGNQQPSGGKHPQVNSFVPPNLGQPYPGSMNPTWGQNFQSNVPFQGNIPNINQNPPQPNLSGLSNYLQTAYGPTGIPTGLPPQNYQFPQVNRQLPFLATLDLPDLSRILNDPIFHSPYWPIIPAKLPSDIPKFDGRSGEDPNNHVMTFHLWCSSNSLMDDSIRLRLFQRTLTGSSSKMVH